MDKWKTSLLAVLALLLGAGLFAPARADQRAFSAGSLIIPMDACYQAAVDNPPPGTCVNGKAPDDGVLKAYGLVYLLLKRGITVFVITNPDKTTVDAVDFTLTHAGGTGPPVGLYNRASQKARDFYSQNQIAYRGSPFVIDVTQASSVTHLLATNPQVMAFTSVAIHVAYDNFIAPVALRMNGVPPRIAVFAPPGRQGGTAGSEGIPLMQAYLRRAGLDYPGAVGTVTAPGEIFDDLSIGDIGGGALASNNYQAAWLPHYDSFGTPSDQAVLAQVAAFADRGGLVVAECASIGTLEGNPGTRFMSPRGIWIDLLPACYPGAQNGWNRSGFSQGLYSASFACFDPRPPAMPYPGSSLRFPLAANQLVQIGDFKFYLAGGAITDWVPGGGTWNAGVVHLIQAQDQAFWRNGSDILAVTNKNNDSTKGQIIYFGGHFYGDGDTPDTAGTRIVLNTLLFARSTLSAGYLSRSGPTMASIGGQNQLFQGTYVENNSQVPAYRSAADVGWPFPQVRGHYVAYQAGAMLVGQTSLSDTTAVLWDAATLLPGPGARRLFTSSGSGSGPGVALIDLSSAGLALLGPANPNPLGLPAGFTQNDVDVLLQRIRSAQLGGIDHSTSAVVGQQPMVPGGATRPTVAYVGALDGMLHAIAVGGGNVAPGSELWGFLPGEQLASVRVNGAALDASPSVGDMYEIISPNQARAWRTLLVVPQGRGGTSVYGLDVSDPLNPVLLWQRGAAASGVLLGNASGAATTIVPRQKNPLQTVVALATSRPAGPAGITVTALGGADGAQLWQFSHGYSRVLPGTPAVVPNDLPPSAVIAASGGGRFNDRVYAADLEGRVWELDAATGANLNAGPLADVGLTPEGDVQPIGVPPALYRSRDRGHQVLVVVTGGADWAGQGDTYALYAFDLDPSVRQPDPGQGQGQGVAPLLFRVPLPAGTRGYAPPTVSGNDIYVMTSSGVLGGAIGASVADPGVLLRINLSSAAVTSSTGLTKGAGAFVGTADGSLYGSTARDLILLRPSGADLSGAALYAPRSPPISVRGWFDPL